MKEISYFPSVSPHPCGFPLLIPASIKSRNLKNYVSNILNYKYNFLNSNGPGLVTMEGGDPPDFLTGVAAPVRPRPLFEN